VLLKSIDPFPVGPEGHLPQGNSLVGIPRNPLVVLGNAGISRGHTEVVDQAWEFVSQQVLEWSSVTAGQDLNVSTAFVHSLATP